MLTPPDGLPDTTLAALLASSWDVVPVSVTYEPVGFGSHHWKVIDEAGESWFATVDEIPNLRRGRDAPHEEALRRLRGALGTAMALRAAGHPYVISPVPTRLGEPMVGHGSRYAIALYPFIQGESFAWGPFSSASHRQTVLHHIVDLHSFEDPMTYDVDTEDFAIPHRDELELALASRGEIRGEGPYAARCSVLLLEHSSQIGGLLDRYDSMAAEIKVSSSPTVLTHGEPHPGNTMRTEGEWVLIDWESALLAPPERDLWMIEPGDGTVIDYYQRATGFTIRPSSMALYELRWDLAELAIFIPQFGRNHTGSADDVQAWDVLQTIIARRTG